MMDMMRAIFRPRVFTGRHMLGFMVTFFGVIIGVNLTMARFAVTSWSGLVVPNTYVASQQFNGKAEQSRAIAAMGYQVDLRSDPDGLSVLLTDRAGQPARADMVTAALRRPVGVLGDRDLTFLPEGDGVYRSAGGLAEGEWIAHVIAVSDGRTIYQRARRLHVGADGSLRR